MCWCPPYVACFCATGTAWPIHSTSKWWPAHNHCRYHLCGIMFLLVHAERTRGLTRTSWKQAPVEPKSVVFICALIGIASWIHSTRRDQCGHVDRAHAWMRVEDSWAAIISWLYPGLQVAILYALRLTPSTTASPPLVWEESGPDNISKVSWIRFFTLSQNWNVKFWCKTIVVHASMANSSFSIILRTYVPVHSNTIRYEYTYGTLAVVFSITSE